MARAYKLLAVLVLAITVALVGCGAAQRAAEEQAFLDVGGCVVGQVMSGDTNPVTIGAACLGVTAKDVEAILNAFLARFTSDGGAGAQAGGLTAPQRARVMRAISRAHAAAAGGCDGGSCPSSAP